MFTTVTAAYGNVNRFLVAAVNFFSYDKGMTIHDRVALLRQQSGLSAREMGRLSGLAHSAITMIEQGKRTPTSETAVQISRLFQVDLNWLLRGIGNHPEEYEVRLAVDEAREVE